VAVHRPHLCVHAHVVQRVTLDPAHLVPVVVLQAQLERLKAEYRRQALDRGEGSASSAKPGRRTQRGPRERPTLLRR
jgi:predicted lipid carrier protein YhbT